MLLREGFDSSVITCVLLIKRLLRLVGRWARKPVNHTSWVAVVTPTDRPKSVRNRCLIELFCGVVCVVTLPFWHFCWCRGFCHRTESDLFLFLFFLVCCGCDTSYIVSVHIQCQASIYTLSLCRGHSWRVRLAKQETLTPPGHLVSPLVYRGPWMSTVVLYCWCHSDIASVLLYFTFKIPTKYLFQITMKLVAALSAGAKTYLLCKLIGMHLIQVIFSLGCFYTIHHQSVWNWN